jgi:DnaA family protein
MTDQYVLPIQLAHEQRFSNYVVGENAELVSALRRPHEEFCGIWIYGEKSSGRTHLLRSKSVEGGAAAQYIGCRDFGSDANALNDALTKALGHGDVVAIDDIGALLGDVGLEELVLGIYQRLISGSGMLIVAHDESSLLTRFALADLGSRMRAMMNFAIKPLDDTQKATLLGERANARGFKISDQVLHYWLTRGPRDMTALLDDLETLDRATLQRKQPLTIPLLKQVLGY